MTKILIKLLSGLSDNQTAEQRICNYGDNYYGDQVCTFKPSK